MSHDDTDADVESNTRRALLASTALGASSLVAGCSGGGGGDGGDGGTPTTGQQDTTTGGTQGTQGTQDTQTPTKTELADVSGQTLTWYTMRDIDTITWAAFASFPTNSGKYIGWPSLFSMTWGLTMETNIRMGNLNPPELTTYEDVNITPEEITIKVKDDANWSNGDPITARDCIASELVFRLIGSIRSPEQIADVPPKDMAISFESITDYEIVDDKTAKLISAGGKFDGFQKDTIYNWITIGSPWGGAQGNTAREPYKTYWETIDSIWTRYKNGEINPWTPEFTTKDAMMEALWGPHGWSKKPKKNNYNQEVEKMMRKPENVHTSGAWDLKSFNGTKSVTLKPNPEYRNADRVNFDEIKVVGRSSQRANRAALKANSQDYYRGTMPQYIAKSFPDDIEQRLQPNGGGLAFAVDHGNDIFKHRLVRHAILHAIDTKRLSRAVHRTKFKPVTTPGADAWGAREILGEEWVKNNLKTFGQRATGKASQLMQEAGFSKEGGKWVDGEGKQLSVTVPTSDTTPQLEPMFANQISAFGIDASLQTYSDSVYSEKWENGEFNIWPTNRGVGFHQDVAGMYRGFVINRPTLKNVFRMFPQEQIEATKWAKGTKNVRPDTPEGFAEFTLQAPPVGDREGELKTWHPGRLSTIAATTSSNAPNYPNLLKKVAWLYNWHLPVIPIAEGQTQHFLDTGHWIWPATDDTDWELAGNGIEDLPPLGLVQANPDNPEEGASVQQ